jgi:hypothetical protein
MLFAHLKRILSLAGFGCAGPAELSSSSRSQPSPRIYAASPSWRRGRRHYIARSALRKCPVRQCQCVDAAAPSGAYGSQGLPDVRLSSQRSCGHRLLQQNLPGGDMARLPSRRRTLGIASVAVAHVSAEIRHAFSGSTFSGPIQALQDLPRLSGLVLAASGQVQGGFRCLPDSPRLIPS